MVNFSDAEVSSGKLVRFASRERLRATTSSENINGLANKPRSRIVLTSTSELPNCELEARCRLALGEHDPHGSRCDIAMSSSLLKHMVAKSVEPTVGLEELNRLTSPYCKPCVLENNCSDKNCTRQHKIGPFPSQDVLVSFAKWFLNNSKEPNCEVLHDLISQLRYGEDLLPLLLRFSSALPKIVNKFRKRIRTALVRKIVRCWNVESWEAVRIMLMFNLTQQSDAATISSLLNCYGLSDSKTTKLYESFGCVWHLIGGYTFPDEVLLKMVGECVREMPGDVSLTKNRLVSDLMKCSRKVLMKRFNVVDSFLHRYYPSNSRVAHHVRSVVLYGAEPVDLNFVDAESGKVRGTGEVNSEWQSWDVHEEQLKAFEMVMRNSRTRSTDAFGATECRESSYPEDLRMSPFMDDVSSKEILTFELCGTVTTDVLTRLTAAIEHRQYDEAAQIIRPFDHPTKTKSLATIMTTTHDSLCRLSEKELLRAVFAILCAIPVSHSKKSARDWLIQVANDIVVKLYRRRDYTGAVTLLKTLRIAEVNPLVHPPQNISQKMFTLVCSDAHFEKRCFREAVKILFYGNCVQYDEIGWLQDLQHFRLLERLTMKMLRLFVRERRAELSTDVFRGIVLAQKDLRKPIDVSPFYEAVLRNACAEESHDGAILYSLIDRTCGNDVIFSVSTYRVLLVALVRSRASDSLLRRTLLLCQKINLYPLFTPGTIRLAACLLTEEIYLYVKHFVQYWIAQGSEELTGQPLTIKIRQTLLPSDNNQPAFMSVANDIPEAMIRLNSVLKEISGLVYDDLFVDFSTLGEATVPTVGVEALVEIVSLA